MSDDQREEFRSLRKRRILGGWTPISDGRPIGDPPTGGSGAKSRGQQLQEEADRRATERHEALKAEARDRSDPIMVQCDVCEFVWPCAYLPMPLARAAALMQAAACPKGCDGRVMLSDGEA